MTYLVESNDLTTFESCTCNCWVQVAGNDSEITKPCVINFDCISQHCVQNACPTHCWTLACSPRLDPMTMN